jgi:hypothetical protein
MMVLLADGTVWFERAYYEHDRDQLHVWNTPPRWSATVPERDWSDA